MSKTRNPVLDKASLRARRVAMALRRLGKPITYSQALEVVATQEGHANWHAYRAHALKSPQSAGVEQSITRPVVIHAMTTYLREEKPFRAGEVFDWVKAMLNKGYLERALDSVRSIEANPAFELATSSWAVVVLSLYANGPNGQVFISKTECVVQNLAEAADALKKSFAGSRFDQDGAQPQVFGELLGTVAAIPTISDTARWLKPQMRQANTEWLDEWVTDVIVDTWTGAINETADEVDQEARIAEAEAHASTINNEGLESQLTALTARWKGTWGEFVVRLKEELDVTGWPFPL